MSCTDRETKRRERHREARLRAWERTGSLYSERAEAHMTQQIRDAFAVEFGPLRECTEAPGDVAEGEILTTSYQYPDDRREMTLEAVGHVLGIGREHVRQIEARALGKLQHALKLLAMTEGHRRAEDVITGLAMRPRRGTSR